MMKRIKSYLKFVVGQVSKISTYARRKWKLLLLSSVILLSLTVITSVLAVLFLPVDTEVYSKGTKIVVHHKPFLNIQAFSTRVDLEGTDKSWSCKERKCVFDTQLEDAQYKISSSTINPVGYEYSNVEKEIYIDSIEPEVKIEYSEFTNKEETSISIETEELARIFINRVEKGIYQDEKMNFDYRLTYEENLFEIIVADKANNVFVKKLNIVLDQEISLELTSPNPDETVPVPVKITGKTDPFAMIYSRKVESQADEEGNFEIEVPFFGYEEIYVDAVDKAGNEATQNVKVRSEIGRIKTVNHYPTDHNFPNLKVCAINVDSGKETCVEGGYFVEILVDPGSYQVYADLKDPDFGFVEDRRLYHTDKTEDCYYAGGKGCSTTMRTFEVKAGETAKNIWTRFVR